MEEEILINKAGNFRKVGKDLFIKGLQKCFGEDIEKSKTLINNSFRGLMLPERISKHSIGYIFGMPFDVELLPGDTIDIPTGIKCELNPGWGLMILPVRNLADEYQLALTSTAVFITGEMTDDELGGHIIARVINNGYKNITLETGDGIFQGIFIPYGFARDDKWIDNPDEIESDEWNRSSAEKELFRSVL